MNTSLSVLYLVIGLVILWKSADLLVDAAVALAHRLGVSALVIGLTIVAMGTSAPEVAASIAAALKGAGDVAIGNVYGSNIANLALVGGVSALLCPIVIKKTVANREMPIMLFVALLLWAGLFDLNLSRSDGLLLLVIFTVLILLAVLAAKKEMVEVNTNSAPTALSDKTLKQIIFIIAGLIGLSIGAHLTILGAVFIGEQIGLSQAVIGLTIIAIGTSLPELVTCVAASLKGHHDISIGNLVGSNIFNTLLVTGVAGTVRPFTIVSRLAGVDYWIMIAVTFVFILIVFAGKYVIGRLGGIILVCIYVGYMVYLLGFTAGI